MKATSVQQRKMIKDLAHQGLTDRQIAEQVELSPYTVRKWRRKSERWGAAGLFSHLGRPGKGAMSTYPEAILLTVKAWRKAHSGWGPKTLCAELRREARFGGCRLPSQSTLTRWLKQEGLSRPYQKHQGLPPVCTSLAEACHQEWEMDARGYEKIPDIGVIALINVNDVYSKAKILSYPCWLGRQRASRHPATEDYQMLLRLCFTEWGLPDRLAVDHDSVFYDNLSKSPFPTRFHLWLLALGIQLTFGRMGQPKDQAMTERSHQTWQHQALDGQVFTSQSELWQTLNERRRFLNYCLPCATLGEVPPLLAFPQASIPRRMYRPEWETDLLDLARVYSYLGQGRWFRKGSNIGAVSLGKTVYCLGSHWKRAEVEITFDPSDLHLVFHTEERQKRLPLRGIGIRDLMGDLDALVHWDAFQLALPFSWKEWSQLHACQLLSGTTL